MICGIYKIENKINGKIYIGQSINITERWYQHKYDAVREERLAYNSIIHKAFRKYGIENFSFEILEECPSEDLDEKERYWIQELNTIQPNGYNIMPGGQKVRAIEQRCVDCNKVIFKGATRCRQCEDKRKSVIYWQNRPDVLTLAEMVKSKGYEQVGKLFNVSGNTIKNWCVAYGLPSRKQDLIKWYNSKMGIEEQPIEKIKKQIKKPVDQIDLKTGEIIHSFESVADAMRFLGLSKSSHIIECCKGKLKQAYGYIWKYASLDKIK